MGRLRRRVLTACAVLALAGPAGAAEITHVATAGEPGNPIDVDFSVRWDRLSESALVSREVAVGSAVELQPQLDYSRISNALVARLAVGLYHDLELHAEIPYILADDSKWQFASGATDTISTNAIGPGGQPCATVPCPLFPVGSGTTVYHGGKAGDLLVGLAWAIFNEKKDDTKPTWVVGFDLTAPTAALYDPTEGRNPADWSSPYSSASSPGPFGEKLWKMQFSTALSRRMGVLDPYVKARFLLQRRSSGTFSNCDAAATLENQTPAQMAPWASPNCAAWADDAKAQPPWAAGIVFGAEVVPWESPADHQKLVIDLRLAADYTSSARWYNELTDAIGKLLFTDDFLTMKATLAVDVRASEYVGLRAAAGIGTATAHWLTGESLGRARGEVPPGPYDATNAALNPNYDARYDAAGQRFRVSSVTLFDFSVTGVLRF